MVEYPSHHNPKYTHLTQNADVLSLVTKPYTEIHIWENHKRNRPPQNSPIMIWIAHQYIQVIKFKIHDIFPSPPGDISTPQVLLYFKFLITLFDPMKSILLNLIKTNG